MPKYIINFTGSDRKKRIAYLYAIHNLRKTAESHPGDYQVQTNIDGTITFTTPNNSQSQDRGNISFIDLKPYFATGAHVQQNKTKPGWHTKVPIQPKQNTLLGVLQSPDKQALQNLVPGQTIQLKTLAQLTGQFNNNITGGVSNKNGFTPAATLFRTVSNNSPINSWITPITNRENNPDLIKRLTCNTDTLSPTELQDVDSTLQDTPQFKAHITNQEKEDLNKQSYNVGNGERSIPQNYQTNLFNNLNDFTR